MKTIRMLGLLTMIFMFCLNSASAQTNQDTKWVKITIEQQNLYMTEDERCLIGFNNNNHRLAISAIDIYRHDKKNTIVAQHRIFIWLDGNDIPRKSEAWDFFSTKPLVLVPRNKPNIFYTECLEDTKKLPLEIQKKFYGFYGLGRE